LGDTGADVSLGSDWAIAHPVGFDPIFFFLHENFSILIEGRMRRGFEKVSAKFDIHPGIHPDELRLRGLEPGGTSPQDLCLEVGKDALADSEVVDSERELCILTDSLCHAWTKSALETSNPLGELRRVITADCKLVDVRQFEGPPSTGSPSEAKLQVVPHCFGALGRDRIFDTFAERINVPVHRVFADCNNVSGRISVVDLQVGLEEAEFFNTPACIDSLACAVSGLTILAGRTLGALGAAKALCELRAVEHAVDQCVEEGIGIRVRGVAGHRSIGLRRWSRWGDRCRRTSR